MTDTVAAPAAAPEKLKAWLTSSTTILGGVALLGIGVNVLTGVLSWQAAIGPAISALAAIAWPQLQAPTRTEIEGVVTGIVAKKLGAGTATQYVSPVVIKAVEDAVKDTVPPAVKSAMPAAVAGALDLSVSTMPPHP